MHMWFHKIFFHFMHCPGPYHRYLMKMQQYEIWMLLQKRIHLIVTSQMQQSVLTILVHSWKQKNNWYLIWENEILCQIVPNRAGTVKMIQKSASKNFWTQFKIVHCQGSYSLRLFILRPYCNQLKNSDFCKFWGSPLVQFSKFNNFLCLCWFLCKTLNFVSLVLKLHNR